MVEGAKERVIQAMGVWLENLDDWGPKHQMRKLYGGIVRGDHCRGLTAGVKLLRLRIALRTVNLSPQNSFDESHILSLVRRQGDFQHINALRCLPLHFFGEKSESSDKK